VERHLQYQYCQSNFQLNHSLFESLGWKVYRVPEAATLLFSAGVSFPDLNEEMQFSFQKSILTVMIQIENTYREVLHYNTSWPN
jgi:hypothetical protein